MKLEKISCWNRSWSSVFTGAGADLRIIRDLKQNSSSCSGFGCGSSPSAFSFPLLFSLLRSVTPFQSSSILEITEIEVKFTFFDLAEAEDIKNFIPDLEPEFERNDLFLVGTDFKNFCPELKPKLN